MAEQTIYFQQYSVCKKNTLITIKIEFSFLIPINRYFYYVESMFRRQQYTSKYLHYIKGIIYVS